MIERLDEQLPEEGTSPYVPGNNDMVAQYTDPDLVETYMTRE
jgi:hypothetical protein